MPYAVWSYVEAMMDDRGRGDTPSMLSSSTLIRRSRRRGRASITPLHLATFAAAVPQVVAHRLGRMAIAGTSPSAADRREFSRMVSEKGAAFQASWLAMSLAAGRAQQTFAWSWLGAMAAPALGGAGAAMARATAELQASSVDVLASGFHPVRRRAVANAKRLRRA